MAYEAPEQVEVPKLSKEEIASALGRRERRPDLRDVTDPNRREELLKEIEQEFFLHHTDAIISYIAKLRNLSPINKNIIFFLKTAAKQNPSTNAMLSARLSYSDIVAIDEKRVAKDQRDTAIKFLADGFENTLIKLFSKPEGKGLSGQELRIKENFKNMETPEGNCYTFYGARKLLEQRFSATKGDKKQDLKSIVYRGHDDATPHPGLIENSNSGRARVGVTVPQ